MTANHMQIVKPSSRTDPRYSRFATALKETALGVSDDTEGLQPNNATPIAGANSGQPADASKVATGEFRVVVDGKEWDSVKSRVVVYDGRYSLIQRVRVFQPNAKSVQIVYKVTGRDLVAAHLDFRGEPSDQGSVHGVAIQSDGSNFLIEDGDTYADIMKLIDDHMRMLKKGKGTYYLEVLDKSGRVFDFDIFQADWSFSANSTLVSSGFSQPSTIAK
jgi:hypothetical protein